MFNEVEFGVSVFALGSKSCCWVFDFEMCGSKDLVQGFQGLIAEFVHPQMV